MLSESGGGTDRLPHQVKEIDVTTPQDSNAQNVGPQYGAPQYSAPQYGAAQYGAPQYGATGYGVPPHNRFRRLPRRSASGRGFSAPSWC